MADELEAQDSQEEQSESRPEWLPENFESPADLLNSYNEAQAKITAQGNALAETREMMDEIKESLSAQPAQHQQQQFDAGSARDQLQDSFDADPLGTMAWMAQSIAAQQLQTYIQQQGQTQDTLVAPQNELIAHAAEQELAQQFEDWNEYKDRVAEAVKADDSLLPNSALSSLATTKRHLERAYKLVKADDVLSKAQEAGVQQANQSRQQKLAARTMSGSSAREPEVDEDEAYLDRLKTAWKGQSYSTLRGG
jgi:hypothetical protein